MDIQKILDKTLPAMGYECVDFEHNAQGTLRIFIDKPQGITIEDCVNVSNHLSRVFTVENVDYKNLEISSPGLDRPLKKPTDFCRFVDSLATVKTRLPIGTQKKFVGRITAFDEQEGVLHLATEEGMVQIQWDNIDKARLKPEF